MELVIAMLLVFAGIITTDQHFDINKAESCSEVGRFESNDLEVDHCLALGKIEQGNKEIKLVESKIEAIENRK